MAIVRFPAFMMRVWRPCVSGSGMFGVVARDGIGLTPHADSTELTDSTFDVEGLNSPNRQSLTQNWHKSERSPLLRPSLENKKPRGGRGSSEEKRVQKQDTTS